MSDTTTIQRPDQAPANLRHSFDAAGTLELLWDYLTDVSDYEVRSTQFRRGSSFSTRIAPGERRSFQVRGRTAGGEGPWSELYEVVGPRPTIALGSTGPWVRTWQANLNFTTSINLVVSGEFDDATDVATKNLQRFFGRPASGVVDEAGWWTIMDFLVAWHTEANKPKPEPTPTPKPEPEPVAPAPPPVVVTPTPAPPKPPAIVAPEGMQLAFSDEFSGSSLDTNVWKPYHSTYGDGNNELQCHTPGNVSVSDGTLKIVAKRERYKAPNGQMRDFTSGFLGTRENGVFFPRYGRYEIRARVPHGQGLWPAFWLRHRDGSHIAEIDVMEYFHSQLPGKTMATLHLDQTYNVVKNAMFIEQPTDNGGWHTWSMDILPDGRDVLFTARVDGKVLPLRDMKKVLHPTWRNAAPNWVTRHTGKPLFDIAINMSIGGNWVGHPDGDNGKLGVLPLVNRCALGGTYPDGCVTTGIRKATFPEVYEVDYVRVFELV